MSLAKNEDPSKSNSQLDAHDSSADLQPTRAAVLTGPGRSAIAVIAIAGADADKAITQCFVPTTSRAFTAGHIRYGTWYGKRVSGGNLPSQTSIETDGESVVVIPIASDELEIHCHGGIAATTRIMDDLKDVGVVTADANDQAWQSTKPIVIREAEQVLSQCLTARTAAVAMDQVRGAMSDWCQSVLRSENLAASQDTLAKVTGDAREMLKYAAFGIRLADRFSVVLAGPPNVGKSSLINAIVGYDRSITMDLAGTTRDVLHADTIIDGIAVRLSDTAGIRKSPGAIEHQGILKAKEAVRSADLVVWVSEPARNEPEKNELGKNKSGIREQGKWGPGKDDDLRQIEAENANVIHVLNKADLLEQPNQKAGPHQLHSIATTAAGVAELMQAIWDALVGHFPPAGSPVPITQRQRDCLSRIAASTRMDECCEWVQRLLVNPQ